MRPPRGLAIVALVTSAVLPLAAGSSARAADPPSPPSGTYENVDTGERTDIEFRPDGTLVMVTLTLQDCPWPGMVVGEGAWNGTSYDVTSYFSNFGASREDCVVSLTNTGWRIEVGVDGLLWCGPDFCSELRRVPPRFVVEFLAWFPRQSLLDPSLPEPVSGWPTESSDLAPVSVSPCLAADRVESSIEGHGHQGVDGPLLAVVRAAFDVNDGVITGLSSNVTDMEVRRHVVARFASGDEAVCDQEVTVPGADVGSVVALGPDQLSLKFDTELGVSPSGPSSLDADETAVLELLGCDDSDVRPCDLALVVPEFPRLRGGLTVVAKPDGTITIEATTVGFASFGVRVLDGDAVIASAVLTDASCHDLVGLAGLERVFALAPERRRVAPTPPAAISDRPCEPVAPSAPFVDGSPSTAWDAQAAFVLATRYADSQ